MSEEKGYGLLISAVVSIVAVVGMVVLFSQGAPTGAVSIQSASFGTPSDNVGRLRAFFSPDCPSGNGVYDIGTGQEYCATEKVGFSRASSDHNRESCYYSDNGELVCNGNTGNGKSFNNGYNSDLQNSGKYQQAWEPVGE